MLLLVIIDILLWYYKLHEIYPILFYFISITILPGFIWGFIFLLLWIIYYFKENNSVNNSVQLIVPSFLTSLILMMSWIWFITDKYTKFPPKLFNSNTPYIIAIIWLILFFIILNIFKKLNKNWSITRVFYDNNYKRWSLQWASFWLDLYKQTKKDYNDENKT